MIRSTAIALALLATAAAAQDMPSYGAFFDQAIRNQFTLQEQGDRFARDVADEYLRQITEHRMRTGDTSYIPGPVSAADLSRSVNALGRQYDRNNAAWHRNSDATTRSIDRWGTAFRGYQTYQGDGQTYQVPTGDGRVFVNPWGESIRTPYNADPSTTGTGTWNEVFEEE